MRKVVVVEGKLLPNGMMLAKGALKDPGKPVPVTMGYVRPTIVGKAVDFERNEETGEISFDIQFAPAYAGGEELIKDGEISLSAYGLEINDDILIESAKIGAACFSPFAGPFSIAKDEPVEGKVIERPWMTVGELIEKLKEFDQNWPVATCDNEYGVRLDVEPRKYKLESYEVRLMHTLGMEEGDQIVVID